MISFKKKEEELHTRRSEAKLSNSKIRNILRTVPDEKAFYFYEGVGKPTKHVAKSLVDFREDINAVGLRSLVFHLRRKDFESWIREVIGDWVLADRIKGIDPNSYDLQVKLYTAISKRIKKLNEVLSASTVTSEDLVVAPPFSTTKVIR